MATAINRKVYIYFLFVLVFVMDLARKFFAGLSSSSDDSTTNHLHHALSMLGIMLEDCGGPVAGTVLLVLVGLMDRLSFSKKPIGKENAKNLEEMTPAATGSHRAADQGKETPFVSILSPFLERIDVEDTSAKGHEIRSNPVVESQKKSNNIDSGKENETRVRPAVESKTKSEKIDLRCKQDKKVVGTHRTSPCFVPVCGDASVVVRSGLVRPTLIRDADSVGYENRQGKHKQLTSVIESKRKSEKVHVNRKSFFSKYQIRSNPLFESKPSDHVNRNRQGEDKRLTSVMKSKRKSQKVDLTRKQDKNVVNMHRMIPHIVSASHSEFVHPTSILKGGKPIESQKHKGQKKRLSSVVESRRKEHIGLVRKQDKQVVGTQRTITGVVPAQGHIPVVRPGFERPTLIQKDSKSIGSEKLQGPEKLVRSVVEIKQKSGNIDSSRKNDKRVVGTRKDLVDERSLRSVSKQKNVQAVPPVPPYKGRKTNSTSELKPRWKF